MLIAESGPTSAGPSVINIVRGYGFLTLLMHATSEPRTPAIFHKNMSNFIFDQVLVAVPPTTNTNFVNGVYTRIDINERHLKC